MGRLALIARASAAEPGPSEEAWPLHVTWIRQAYPEESYNSVMATTSYLDRLLEPLTEALTPKMASVLLGLRADSEMEAHIGELRRKANAGALTPAEDAEYKDFVEAVDLISIMQAKARRFLAKQSA